jgi:surface antigen/peptidoglycan hydrolase CwlO-like protein
VKAKNKKTFFLKKTFSRIALGVCAAVVAIATTLQFSHSSVWADRYDEQISIIQNEVNQLQSKAGELNAKANSLKATVNALNAEKRTIQAQVDLSQAKFDKLTNDIAKNEQKLAENKQVLGEIIASMYVDDTISPIEMLASSNNVGDYIDKQEYRTAASEKLNSTIAAVKELKTKLEKDKKSVERVLADQKAQKDALAAKEAEKQTLLTKTKGEEAAYRELSAGKQSEIDELRRQQAAELAARAAASGGYTDLGGDPNRGGYPAQWANAPMNAYVDDWGMYTRQCVSYAAFKVASTYGNMPYWGGRGNANEWPGNAIGAGIPIGSVPKVGSVGVITSGEYGHVGWVESVNNDGTITISHYNVGWNGEFARWVVSPSYFDTYIYFGEW